jgi:hypothetical protein
MSQDGGVLLQKLAELEHKWDAITSSMYVILISFNCFESK